MDKFEGMGTAEGGFEIQKNQKPWSVFRFPDPADPVADSWGWGSNTLATQMTAFALLWEVTGLILARQFYMRFTREVMVHLPVRPGWQWTMTGADIVGWLVRTVEESRAPSC